MLILVGHALFTITTDYQDNMLLLRSLTAVQLCELQSVTDVEISLLHAGTVGTMTDIMTADKKRTGIAAEVLMQKGLGMGSNILQVCLRLQMRIIHRQAGASQIRLCSPCGCHPVKSQLIFALMIMSLPVQCSCQALSYGYHCTVMVVLSCCHPAGIDLDLAGALMLQIELYSYCCAILLCRSSNRDYSDKLATGKGYRVGGPFR